MEAATQTRSLDEHRQKQQEADGGEQEPAGEAAEGAEGAAASGAEGGEQPPAEHEGEQPKADLEGEGEGEQALPAIILEGDGQLSLRVGGAKPDKATVKLRGGSIGIPQGQYEKGDTVNLMVKVKCAEVHFVDKTDGQTGEVTETERRHVFKISGVERID